MKAEKTNHAAALGIEGAAELVRVPMRDVSRRGSLWSRLAINGRVILRRFYRLLLMQFISGVGRMSAPGQWPSGVLQAWALRQMGVQCPSSDVWIGPRTSIDDPHRLHLGRRVVIGADSRFTGAKANIMIEDDFLSASGLYINTGSHDLDTLQPTYLPVVIGRRVWCGMRVTICAGVSIGDNAVLGAGAVVLKNMPANHVAAGVPCKAIREIERPDRGADADWTNFKR